MEREWKREREGDKRIESRDVCGGDRKRDRDNYEKIKAEYNKWNINITSSLVCKKIIQMNIMYACYMNKHW